MCFLSVERGVCSTSLLAARTGCSPEARSILMRTELQGRARARCEQEGGSHSAQRAASALHQAQRVCSRGPDHQATSGYVAGASFEFCQNPQVLRSSGPSHNSL